MATLTYQYTTIVRRGYEIGIIRCQDINLFARFDDALALHHRPLDRRVLLWDGFTGFGLDSLTALLGPTLINSLDYEWTEHELTV
jgi:hypothetical protein